MLSMVATTKKPSGGFGGFGAAPKAPPTLKEVVRTFKSRLPKDTSVCCPCGTGEPYAECCRPYHRGELVAETPERLLRTRYSAFAFRLIPYIIETTDKSNADYMRDKVAWAKKLNKKLMFDGFEFVSLEIGALEAGANDDEAFLAPNVFTRESPPAPSDPPHPSLPDPRPTRASASAVLPAQTSQPPLVMRERTKCVRKDGASLCAGEASRPPPGSCRAAPAQARRPGRRREAPLLRGGRAARRTAERRTAAPTAPAAAARRRKGK